MWELIVLFIINFKLINKRIFDWDIKLLIVIIIFCLFKVKGRTFHKENIKYQ